MLQEKIRELVILGAGPAGLTAAIYGKRAGLDVLLIEKGIPGGQIMLTDEIENWPGTINITGGELAENFRKHAVHLGAEFLDTAIKGLEINDDTKTVITDSGKISAKAVIIATGASFRKAGCEGEGKFTGRGVSYCAVCDAAFFEDETIAVIGGGNTAIEEALYLTQFASKIYIIHRRDAFRADEMLVKRALAHPKIEPVWSCVPQSIEGDELVERIVVKNIATGEVSSLDVAGVFVFVGTQPNVEFLGSLLDRAGGGWIKTNSAMETSVRGIFAAGDVRDTHLRQVVTAAGDGAVAAMSAYSYISENFADGAHSVKPKR